MNTVIINKLKELKPTLKEKYDTKEFAILGSVAKGTYTTDSDVDIAVLRATCKFKHHKQLIFPHNNFLR